MQRPQPSSSWAFNAHGNTFVETYCFVTEGGFIRCGSLKEPLSGLPFKVSTSWITTGAPGQLLGHWPLCSISLCLLAAGPFRLSDWRLGASRVRDVCVLCGAPSDRGNVLVRPAWSLSSNADVVLRVRFLQQDLHAGQLSRHGSDGDGGRYLHGL